MKTLNEYELLKLERFRSRRRERRGWKRRLGCWLWLLLAVLLLALWLVGAAKVGDSTFNVERSTLNVQLAGFGVPDWVAFGVVMTLVLAVLGRLAWGWCVEADERSAYEEESALGEIEREMQSELRGPVVVEPEWVVELRAFFERRGALMTRRQCDQVMALCVPRHQLDLVMLDAFLRREMGQWLFVTSLKEVQAICGGGAEMGTGVTALTGGKEGSLL